MKPKAITFMATALAMSGGYIDSELDRVTPKDKVCRNCDKIHTHHNDYCSADCCKEYRAKKRGPK